MGMIIRDVCPRCKSPQYKKNGHIHNGKQNPQCQNCGRQFVDCFDPYLISDETRSLIERLLLERLSLRGICRAVGVGLKWLLGFLVTCFEALPDHLNVQADHGQRRRHDPASRSRGRRNDQLRPEEGQ